MAVEVNDYNVTLFRMNFMNRAYTLLCCMSMTPGLVAFSNVMDTRVGTILDIRPYSVDLNLRSHRECGAVDHDINRVATENTKSARGTPVFLTVL